MIKNKRIFWALATFIGSFAYTFMFMWQGIDFTDAGSHLVTAQLAINNHPYYDLGMVWLSDWFAGLWLLISNPLGLAGARLGGCLILSTTATVSYWVLSYYFAPIACFFATIFSTLTCLSYGNRTINYNTFPALLIIGVAALIISTEIKPLSPKSYKWRLTFTGILVGITVMARLPALPMLFFPFLFCLLHDLIYRSFSPQKWKRATLTFFIAAATIGVFIMILTFNDLLSKYISNILYLFGSANGNVYSAENTFKIYYDQLVVSASFIGQFSITIAVAALATLIVRRICPKEFRDFILPVFFGVICLWTFLKVEKPDDFRIALPAVYYIFCIVILVIFFWKKIKPAATKSSKEREFANQLLGLSIGIVITSFTFIGSGNGVKNASFGLWFAFPMLFLIFPSFIGTIKPGLERKTAPYTWSIFIAIAITAATIFYNNPYRDVPNRSQLTYPLTHPRIKGIMTTKSRGQSVDELFYQLDKYVKPGEIILAYKSIPMVHYVTKTIPLLGNPWPTILPVDTLKTKLAEAQKQPLPEIVVKAKTNTWVNYWGVVPNIADPYSRSRNNDAIIENWVVSNGYREIWSNADFSISMRY